MDDVVSGKSAAVAILAAACLVSTARMQVWISASFYGYAWTSFLEPQMKMTNRSEAPKERRGQLLWT